MSGSLNEILVLSYFPCSDFPGLLVCDEGDFEEMHTTKIVFFADTSTFFANVTGLIGVCITLLRLGNIVGFMLQTQMTVLT